MKPFKFDKTDITHYIEYKLKTLDEFKEPLNYVIKSLERLGHSLEIKSLDKINLHKVKEHEGKNYYWSVFTYKNVTLAVRRYRQHLTIFTKVDKGVNKYNEVKAEYGAFTLNTDMEQFGDKHDEMLDKYYSKPLTDLNLIFKDLIKLLIERGVHWIWNSACIKIPKHIKAELIFDNKSINSIDSFAFCMEELECIYLGLFSENTMLQKLKDLKTGKMLDKRYKIGKIRTTVKDEYYHDAGIELIDTMNKDEKSFKDVYSLTRWYFNEIFKNNIYIYDGEVYVKGGELKANTVAAYKKMDEATLFQDSFPKENFTPLKKYLEVSN